MAHKDDSLALVTVLRGAYGDLNFAVWIIFEINC